MTPEPPLTEEELAEMEARVAAAEPGPWRWEARYNVVWIASHFRGAPYGERTATFVAHARTDVSRLIAALRAKDEQLQGAIRAHANVRTAKDEEIHSLRVEADAMGEIAREWEETAAGKDEELQRLRQAITDCSGSCHLPGDAGGGRGEGTGQGAG